MKKLGNIEVLQKVKGMEESYKSHEISVDKFNVDSRWFFTIKGRYAAVATYSTTENSQGFDTPEEALKVAKSAIDSAFDGDRNVGLSRHLTERDFEHFVQYLRKQGVDDSSVHSLAIGLASVNAQRLLGLERLRVDVDGSIDASVSGSIEVSEM